MAFSDGSLTKLGEFPRVVSFTDPFLAQRFRFC